jgi:hypothetical protein
MHPSMRARLGETGEDEMSPPSRSPEPFTQRILYRLTTDDRVETLVRSSPGIERRAKRAAQRYVAGTSLAAPSTSCDGSSEMGWLDLFGEGLADPDLVDRTVRASLVRQPAR